MPNRSASSRSKRLAGKDSPASVGTVGLGPVERHVELDPAVRWSGGEEVDDAHLGPRRRDRRPGRGASRRRRVLAAARPDPSAQVRRTTVTDRPARAPPRASRTGHSATEWAAASSKPVSGQAKTPMAAHTASPPTSGAVTGEAVDADGSAISAARAACGGRG